MLTPSRQVLEIRNARIVDPLHADHGRQTSLFVHEGKFIDPPRSSEVITHTIDLDGALALAGGIDIHTHIGGGKVNLSRMLMEEVFERSERVVWPTVETGGMYSRMGYTMCFEPAMLLSGARHTHMELADTPYLDSGAYVVLGNEDWMLEALAGGADDHLLQAMVAWSMAASQATAVKVVNPGGISAFKFNQRALDVDERHAKFGVTPRDIIRRLTAAIDELAIPHPLHVHAGNLGAAGNIAATLQTLDAAEGRRIHLTHAQFNSYSCVGPFGMGSGAEQLAKYVNNHPNVTVDVGQVIFGRTVTISADTAAQYRNRKHASPARWFVNDTECQAGCGVVPIHYQSKQYVHSLQWTIGLELMLLIEDPWRVFLTTDHPNGGPFTCYPHLIRLLMDRSFRQSMLDTLDPRAAERSPLRDIQREYTLDEIAIATRAAPARVLGLKQRGTLQSGAIADLAAYDQRKDWEATFSAARCVIKGGVEVVRNGITLDGALAVCQTHRTEVDWDAALIERIRPAVEQTLRMPMESLQISNGEFCDMIQVRRSR